MFLLMNTLKLHFFLFSNTFTELKNILPLADIPVVLASAPAESDLLLSRSLQIFEENPLKCLNTALTKCTQYSQSQPNKFSTNLEMKTNAEFLMQKIY